MGWEIDPFQLTWCTCVTKRSYGRPSQIHLFVHVEVLTVFVRETFTVTVNGFVITLNLSRVDESPKSYIKIFGICLWLQWLFWNLTQYYIIATHSSRSCRDSRQSWYRISSAPWCNCRVMIGKGACKWDEESWNLNGCKIIVIANLASYIIKFCPITYREPPPNEMWENLPFVALETPFENLSGLFQATCLPIIF